jgi:hypothetical protein
VEASVELGSHLEGLNGYLAAQHTPVESLRMAAPEGVESRYPGEQTAGQGTGAGTGQGEHPGAGANAQRQVNADAAPAGAIHNSEISRTSTASNLPGAVDVAAQAQANGGAYISVEA